METTATNDASFHNTMKEHKAAVLGLIIKILSFTPGVIFLLLVLIGVIASGTNVTLPAQSLTLSTIMLVISFIQFGLRYIADESFDLKGPFAFSAFFAAVWFLSLTCSL